MNEDNLHGDEAKGNQPLLDLEHAQRPRLGLALGGGAARGIAHIGVLQVLWDNDIAIDAIAGTSAGAMVGALIAAGITPDELAQIAKTSNWWFLAKDVSLRAGLLKSVGIERWLRRHIKDRSFQELAIPLAVVTSNLVSGETVVFTQGDVAWAARVSATVPGIYAPVEHEGSLLVDGGLTQNVPVDTLLQMGVDVALAVSLNGSFLHQGMPERPAETIQQAISILQRAHVGEQLAKAHLAITPDLQGLGLTDFKAAEQFLELGREAMERALPELRARLQTWAERTGTYEQTAGN